MAGDWVKMRVWMAKDPKVIAIADRLAKAKAFRDWLGCDCVTRRVTVSVTVTALLQVWGVAKEQGVEVGDDLHLSHADLDAIDAIADVPGFGEAMASVGWAVPADGVIVLPNYFRRAETAQETTRRRAARRKQRQRERDANVTVTRHERDMSVTETRHERDMSVTGYVNGDASSPSVASFSREMDEFPGYSKGNAERDIKRDMSVTGHRKVFMRAANSPFPAPLLSPPVNPPLISPQPLSPVQRTQRGFTGDGNRPEDVKARFATFWTAYPRKEAKQTALKAFTRLAPDKDTLDAILQAIDRQKKHGCLEPRAAGDGRSVIPHPATWLNGRRWEDEESVAPPDHRPPLISTLDLRVGFVPTMTVAEYERQQKNGTTHE